MNRFLAFMLMGGLFGCSSAIEVVGESSRFSEAGTAGEVVGGSDTGGKATGSGGDETGNGAAVNGGSNTGGINTGGVACVPKTCDEVAKEKFQALAPKAPTDSGTFVPVPINNANEVKGCGDGVDDGCGNKMNCGECSHGSACGGVNFIGTVDGFSIPNVCGGYVKKAPEDCGTDTVYTTGLMSAAIINLDGCEFKGEKYWRLSPVVQLNYPSYAYCCTYEIHDKYIY